MSNSAYDFYRIQAVATKKDYTMIYPEFLVRPRMKDLMVRGGKFYAIIDKSTGFWITDEGMVQEVVDQDLQNVYDELRKNAKSEMIFIRKEMQSFKSRSWIEYKQYVSSLPDNFHQLDNKLCFKGDDVKPEDYISKCLPYELKSGSYDSWNELVGTLYTPEEKEKIEWAIGSIVAGDSKDIQKFVVLYGDPGAGKGTIIEIIKKLFVGYFEVFDAKSISNNNNAFAFEQFRSNPLVALQSDGDLSRIEDNTKINSIVSHETIVMNEKRKQSYNFTPHCFLFMASNKPVKITDAKSGIIRRLIDIHPSGVTLPKSKYDILMERIGFELGAIAWHCREVYRELGKNYFNGYRPLSMMYQTDAFFNFMEDKYDIFMEEDGIDLRNAYEMWKNYCVETGIDIHLPRYRFREEFKNYFVRFDERIQINGESKYSWFSGFRTDRFKSERRGRKDIPVTGKSVGLVLDQKKSLLDTMLADCQAQYGEEDGMGGTKPIKAWVNVDTTLKNLDTSKIHFVRLPKNHIVIDFDLKNEKGEKDALLNLEAADKWPKTYAEYSQGGKGIHLHYIYDGDPEELASLYSKDIEIKVYKGKSSLRRRLIACNNIPVATISCGLPKKEVKDGDMLDFDSIKDEKHIRNIIAKCLKKEIAQPYTAPAMSLIKKTLDDAYAKGIKYDIRDLRPAIRSFAAKSSHQKPTCMKMCEELHWFSKHYEEDNKWLGTSNNVSKKIENPGSVVDTVETRIVDDKNEPMIFFDIEVFPNLLLVNWKEAGEGKAVVRMINPTRTEIGDLLHRKLVGFNCRRYDNHILYARYLGYDNESLYRLSQRIINGSSNSMFGPAYDISYTDVYDFAAKKQSLKKWEIELGIHHQELGLPWDQPVPEDKWTDVAKYCDNDVIATEAVFNILSGDFKAREILADIAGMSVNDTTNMLTTRIIFGDDPKPQIQFNYPDLAKKFPGYKFENGKSTLNGVEIGEGGRVYAVPGIYHNVITYDVASMHPSSIIAENGFGKYTERFKQLMDIRVAIKHKDFDKAGQMLDGKLKKYLTNKDQAKALSQALKIAINSVYGLTAAGFDNKFRDPRNKDNWVAKRGALFMETLRLNVQKMGATVVHIKTDSIKIQNPTEEVTNYILNFGKEWGYNFEIEDIYEKICLVNDAVYIALRDKKDLGWLDECEKAQKDGNKGQPTRWTATGAQFQHPYVFKHLFSKEPIEFTDLCETKTVTSALYLDMNENLSDVSAEERDLEKLKTRVKKLLKDIGYTGSYSDWLDEEENVKPHVYLHKGVLSPTQIEQIENELVDLNKDANVLAEIIYKGHNYIFIGKAGSFCPVKPGCGGGILCREKDGKFYSATGAKGYRWREGETLVGADRMDMIDMTYFEDLAKTAIQAINEFGPFEEFVKEQATPQISLTIKSEDLIKIAEKVAKKHGEPGIPPWLPPCGDPHYDNCYDCPLFDLEKVPPECKKGYDLTRYFKVNPDALNSKK